MVNKTFVPYNKRILIRPIEEKVSAGGIVMPFQQSGLKRGKVVAFASGIEISTVIDETVWFDDLGSMKIEVNGEKLLLVREADVYGFEYDEV